MVAVLLTLAILVLSFVLIKAADFVVISIRRLSVHAESKAFAISAILLALATSFPELSVAISSSLDQAPSLSLGNVLGANIANISLVAGAAALLAGRVKVHGAFLKRDVFFALIFGLTPLIMILDRSISRVDGIILILAYLAYTTGFIKKKIEFLSQEMGEKHFALRMFRKIEHINGDGPKELAKLFVGVAVMLFSANLIVGSAQRLAVILNVPLFLVGLILVSLGTTLPELAFSVRSLKDGEPTMFFGNILGSVIANSTLILGVAAAIYPITVSALDEYAIAISSFVLIFLTFWLFIRSKMTLERWEAGVMLGLYLCFAVMEFIF
jgi:cation:H+ antiporter